MADPYEGRVEIMEALNKHFARSNDYLSPEQVAEMTALDVEFVEFRLAELYKNGEIEGIKVVEIKWPVQVTGVRYAAA